jgi:hypothetical protein
MLTAGQIAYEEDVRRKPTYHTGEKRKSWHELDKPEQMTWERNPTSRDYVSFNDVCSETAYGSTQRLSFAIRVF